jgi:hypothetical protein
MSDGSVKDTGAGAGWVITTEQAFVAIGKETWHLLVKNQKITANVEKQAHLEPIRKFWHRKDRVQENAFTTVNWSHYQTKHWITKRAARNYGANAVLFQRNQRKVDRCPFCGESETVVHVYNCKYQEVQGH